MSLKRDWWGLRFQEVGGGVNVSEEGQVGTEIPGGVCVCGGGGGVNVSEKGLVGTDSRRWGVNVSEEGLVGTEIPGGVCVCVGGGGECL